MTYKDLHTIYIWVVGFIIIVMLFSITTICSIICDKKNKKLKIEEKSLYLEYQRKDVDKPKIDGIVWLTSIIGVIAVIVGLILTFLQNPEFHLQNETKVYNGLPFWFISRIIGSILIGIGLGVFFSSAEYHRYLEFWMFVKQNKKNNVSIIK